jgi:hypothetical protein
MAQHIDNLRGEQGGAYVTGVLVIPVGVDVMMAVADEADTIIASMTQPDFSGISGKVGLNLAEGTTVWGKITAMEVSSGTMKVFYHKKAPTS